jgi:hypothetical protein
MILISNTDEGTVQDINCVLYVFTLYFYEYLQMVCRDRPQQITDPAENQLASDQQLFRTLYVSAIIICSNCSTSSMVSTAKIILNVKQ